MNKTMKRILALILTLCTVFGLMVPVVFATDTTNTFFDFTTTGSQIGVTWDIIRNATNKDLKIGGTIGTSGDCDFGVNAQGIQVEFSKKWDTCHEKDADAGYGSQTGRWFAVEIKNVPAGTYDAKFALTAITNGGYANLFIVDSKAYGEQDAVYFSDSAQGYTNIPLDYTNTLDMFGKLSFIKETLYDSCKISYNGNSSVNQSVGAVTFEKTGDYVLIFQCKDVSTGSAPQFSVKSLTLTPAVATVGDVAYTDVAKAADAIAAAEENDAVKITGNLQLTEELTTLATITVNEGAVLDLNGNTLSSKSVICNGTGAVKDSQNGAGRIVATNVVLKTDNQHLVVNDTREGKEGYRVYAASVACYKPTFANGTDATEGVKFRFALNFTNKDAYDAIETSGLTVQCSWSVDANDVLTFKADTVKEWAGKQYDANEGETYGLYVVVRGLENTDSLTITPTIGNLPAAAITYPAQ